ncbi:MAG: hypothetical protein ABI867_39660 [Kofleriaceae bacterium]
MIRIGWIMIIGVAGCFPSRSAELACDITDDCDGGRTCENGFCVLGTSDAGPEQPDADENFDCTPLNGRHFVGCEIPQPSAELTLPAGVSTFNTDSGTFTTGGVTGVATGDVASGKLISVKKLTIPPGATLRVIGAKPMIVASWSTIDVGGVIDASSTATEAGGGSNLATSCDAARAAKPGGNNGSGAGAGGGGGFGDAGGRGGGGNGQNSGGAGGLAQTAAPLLSGGCNGASGGNGQGTSAGPGGLGGGAIQLTALESITVNGTIHAGGGGGKGALGTDGGGGGGGAGGMIGLESTTITLVGTTTLAANGGGGGGGSGGGAAGSGGNGKPSSAFADFGVGAGGEDGGFGAAGPERIGEDGFDDPAHGGGAGGGGVGFIIVAATNAPTMVGTISPNATIIARP